MIILSISYILLNVFIVSGYSLLLVDRLIKQSFISTSPVYSAHSIFLRSVLLFQIVNCCHSTSIGDRSFCFVIV